MEAQPLRTIADLGPGEHVCFLYPTEEQYRAVMTPFLRHGLERGDKVIYLQSTHDSEPILSDLRDGGWDVEASLNREQLIILSYEEILPEQNLHPETLVAFLQAELKRTLDSGYAALRVVGELPEVVLRTASPDVLIDLEAKLDTYLADSECLILCPYDQRRFTPELLLTVLRTHPTVIAGTEVYGNFYYIPPAELVGQNLAAVSLRYWLQNLAERKQVEEHLRESAESFRNLAEQSPNMIFINKRGRIVYANEECVNRMGYVREDFLAPDFDFLTLIAPESRDQVRENLRQHMRGKEIPPYEYTLLTKDGRRFEAIHTTKLIQHEGETAILGIITDITPHKRAEEALRESVENFRTVTEQSPNMIFINQRGRVTYANRKCEEMMGYTRKEFYAPDFDFIDLIAPESRELIQDNFRRHMQGEELSPYEYTLLTKGGERIAAIYTSKLIQYEGEPAILGTITDITGIKQAERALRESEEKYRLLIENASEAIVVAQDEQFKFWNPKVLEITGYTPEELTVMPFPEVIHPDDRSMVIERYRRRIKGEKPPSTYHFRIIDKAGKVKWVEINAVLISWDSRPATLNFLTDITERVLTEMALQESEEQYRTTLDSMGDAIHVVDADLRFVLFNEAFKRWNRQLGLETDVIGQRLRGVFPFLPDLVFREYHQVFDTGKLLVTEEVTDIQGQTIVTETRKIPIFERGRVARVITVIRDITQRKRAMEELQRRAEELKVLHTLGHQVSASLSPGQVVETALSGILVGLSPDLAMLYLRQGDELHLLGMHAGKPGLYDPAIRLLGQSLCELAVNEGQPIYSPDVRTDLRCKLDEREEASVRSFVALPLLKGKDVLGVLAIASIRRREFSEQAAFLEALAGEIAIGLQNALLHRQVQSHAAELEQRVAERTVELDERVADVEQLNRAMTNLLEDLQAANRKLEDTTSKLQEVNEELEAFVYSVSHDLRAPLRGIEGFADALLEDYGYQLPPGGQEYARRVIAAAQRLDTLIQDLLAYSRLSRTELRLQPLNLENAVQEALSLCAAGIREKMAHIEVASPLPEVMGHRTTLEQIIANLLSNAIKFVAPEVQPHVRIWAEEGDESVRLWMEDNGIGIAPEDHDHIFGIFERLHGIETYPGTGIGLAVVQKGVTRMDGRIGVESEVGKGSRFWIELKRA